MRETYPLTKWKTDRDAAIAAARYVKEALAGNKREVGAGIYQFGSGPTAVFGVGPIKFGGKDHIRWTEADRTTTDPSFGVGRLVGVFHTHPNPGQALGIGDDHDFSFGVQQAAASLGARFSVFVLDRQGNFHFQRFRGNETVPTGGTNFGNVNDPEIDPSPAPTTIGAVTIVGDPSRGSSAAAAGDFREAREPPPDRPAPTPAPAPGVSPPPPPPPPTKPKRDLSATTPGMWVKGDDGKYVWKGDGPPVGPRPPDEPPQSPPTKLEDSERTNDGGQGLDPGDGGSREDPTGDTDGGGDESWRFQHNYLPMETRALLGFAELGRAHAPERPAPPGGGGPTDRGWKPMRARGAAATHPPEGPPGGYQLQNALIDEAASRLTGGRIPRMGTDGPGQVPLNAAALAKAARPILRTVGDAEEAAAKASRDELRQLLWNTHVAPIIRTAHGARAVAKRGAQ